MLRLKIKAGDKVLLKDDAGNSLGTIAFERSNTQNIHACLDLPKTVTIQHDRAGREQVAQNDG